MILPLISMKKIPYLLLSCMSLGLLHCKSNVEVFPLRDKQYFSTRDAYQFNEVRVDPSIEKESLQSSIQSWMENKGYSAENGSSILLNARFIIKETETTKETITQKNPHYSNLVVKTYKSEPDLKKEGTLFIDLLEARTEQLVWKGSSRISIPDGPEEREKVMKKQVKHILRKLPAAGN